MRRATVSHKPRMAAGAGSLGWVLILGLTVGIGQVPSRGQEAVARPLMSEFQGDLSSAREQVLSQLQKRGTTRRTRVARLDRTAFDGDRIQLSLFPDLEVTAERSDIGFTGIRSRSWTGRLNDGGSAAFILNGDRISGTISSPKGNLEIFPLGGGDAVVVQHEPDAYPECGVGKVPRPPDPAGAGVAPPLDTHDVLDAQVRGKAVTKTGRAEPADTPTENRIRVIVAYTSDAQNLTSSSLGRTMQEHIDLAVLESNQGYANSGVTLRLELACLYETVFNESAAIENDVAAFRNNGDGIMDEIHSMRTNYDADMACLIIDGTDPDWCGWAFDFNYTSYANMFQATVFSCATGSFTFAHEFGHTQGCRHNDDGTLTPFPYGHGFRNGSNWRTIMGLANGTGAPRLNFWSNPGINSPVAPFTAMGTPVNGSNFASDNRTALNVSDNTVVNHEATPVNASTPAGASFASDEAADKLVTGTLTAGSFTANAGSRVQFRAGSSVVLNPGFWARAGSRFHARLAGPLGDPAPSGDEPNPTRWDKSSGQKEVL